MAEFDHAGVRLKTARMAAGYKSATDFCDEYNIPLSTYSLHETGKRNLKPKIAKKYAELLSVNATWLLTGSGLPYNTTEQDNPLTEDEFIELLKYGGHGKIKNPLYQKTGFLNNVNPLVFCKIIIQMIETIQKSNINLETKQFSEKAAEIYKDISMSSDDQESQLAMIELSMTTFKRELQKLTNKK